MDNHHCSVTPSQISCGVAQLYNLSSDPQKVLYAVATQFYHPSKGSSYAFLMWSDTEESNGVKLDQFIFKTIHEGEWFECQLPQKTRWVENPKTSNGICVWIWEIPHERLKAWYISERVKKAQKL